MSSRDKPSFEESPVDDTDEDRRAGVDQPLEEWRWEAPDLPVSEVAQDVAVYDPRDIDVAAFDPEDDTLIQLVHDTIEATKVGLRKARETVDRIDQKLERAARSVS